MSQANAFPDDPPIARVVRRIDNVIGLAEQVVLFGLLVFLVFVTCMWFFTEHFGTPLEDASYDVRYTCFLSAMLGGAFAAHHRRLLSMDVASHFARGKAKAWMRVTTTTFAAVIAGLFLKYGIYVYESTSAEKNNDHWMPAIAANGAMALGAGLLLFHLIVQVVIDIDYLARGKTPPEPEMGAI